MQPIAELIDHDKLWYTQPVTMRPAENGLTEINGVKGYLTQGDIELLFQLAARVPTDGRILEVGSWMGLSSIFLANGLVSTGNYGARICCVDTWRGSEEHQAMDVILQDRLFDTFRDNVTKAGVAALIDPVRLPSVEAAAQFADGTFDLIFIDGDHSFEGCYQDLVGYYPKLKPGGTFVGHDCAPGSGVMQAVEKFSAEQSLKPQLILQPVTHFMFELEPV